MKHADGQAIIAIAGVVVVAAAPHVMHRAYQLKFIKHRRMGSASPRTRKVVIRLGQVCGIARGVVFGTIWVSLTIAAKDANPRQAKGVDSALRALAHTPLGPWRLVIVALGLMTFGVYSWCEARWCTV